MEPHPVGDTQANLLRIVLVKDKEGWIVSEEFATPLYFRLSRSNFNTETIFITDDNGNEVPFEDATVQVTLHFDRPVTCSRIAPNRIWQLRCGTRMQRGSLVSWKQPVGGRVQTSLSWSPEKPLLMEARFFKSKARLHAPFSTRTSTWWGMWPLTFASIFNPKPFVWWVGPGRNVWRFWMPNS